MLQLQSIAKSFGRQALFANIQWQIKPKCCYGLVGPNGAGKTTLLRILAGELPADSGGIVRPKQYTIGFLAQEMEEFGDGSVLQTVLSGMPGWVDARDALTRIHERMAHDHAYGQSAQALADLDAAQTRFERLGGEHVPVRAQQALGGLGFTREQTELPARALSGGWRMRAALARLLVLSPDLLLLDEPTNHLDFESLAWFESFLESYEGAIVAVSHDRYFLNRVPSHIVELTPKGVFEHVGGYEDFLEGKALRLTQQDAAKAKVDKQRAHLQHFVDRFRAKASKAKQAQSRMKMLAKLENVDVEGDAASITLRFAPPPRTGKEVIRLAHVDKAWGSNVVYTDLSTTIWRGDKVALVGPNGAGKSTLLKILAGVTDIQGGELIYGAGVKTDYYAQHQLEQLDAASSIIDEARRAAASDATISSVRSLLGSLRFSGQMVDKKIAVLSGGEKARVALAKMVLRQPNVLLLDEPTNHLDLISREVLEDALSEFPGTAVLVSHDRYFINAVATHVLEVQPGGHTTLYPGDYDAYLYRKSGGDPAVIERLLRGELVLDREPGRAAPPVAGLGTGETRADDKARKREEAERRNELGRRTKPLRERLTALEAEIAKAEARLAGIATEQLDPALYADGERVRTLQIEHAGLQSTIDAAMAKWEDLALRIEAIEGELGETAA